MTAATKSKRMTLLEIEEQLGPDIVERARAVPHPLAWCTVRALDALSADSRRAYRSLERLLKACGYES